MTLLQSIDAAMNYFRRRKCPAILTKADVEGFCTLADEVYLLAHQAGLLAAVPRRSDTCSDIVWEPPVKTMSKLHVAGYWYPETTGELKFIAIVLPTWYDNMDALRILAAELKQKRAGRPKADETDKQLLVHAALMAHHQTEPDGSCLVWTPVGCNQLARGSNKSFSAKTASLFFKDHFGGHENYKTMCHRREVGRKLIAIHPDM